MSNTTLPELQAMALKFNVDISAKAGQELDYSQGADKKVVDTFCSVVKHFAGLTPRNRYLLARAIYVMFDIAAEVPPEDK